MFRQVKSGNAETIALTVGTDKSKLSSNLQNIVSTDANSLKTGYIGIVAQDKIYGFRLPSDGKTYILTASGAVDHDTTNHTVIPVSGLRVVMMGTDAPNYNGGVIVWDKTDAEFPVPRDFFQSIGSFKIGDHCIITIDATNGIVLAPEKSLTVVDASAGTIDYEPGIIEYCGSDDKNVWIRIL